MYHQTLHERPNFGGYLSRDPADYEQWLATRPWEKYFYDLIGGRMRWLEPDEREALLASAAHDQLRYLILYKNLFPTVERAADFQNALVVQELGLVRWESSDFAVVELHVQGTR